MCWGAIHALARLWLQALSAGGSDCRHLQLYNHRRSPRRLEQHRHDKPNRRIPATRQFLPAAKDLFYFPRGTAFVFLLARLPTPCASTSSVGNCHRRSVSSQPRNPQPSFTPTTPTRYLHYRIRVYRTTGVLRTTCYPHKLRTGTREEVACEQGQRGGYNTFEV